MHMQKIGFVRRREVVFTLYEWKSLIYLLENRKPLDQCFLILRNAKNELLVDKIEKALQSGISFNDIVKEFSDDIAKRVSFLLNFMSLISSLRISIKMHEFEEEAKNKFLGIITYPIFVIVSSIVILLTFTNVIVPNILNMFNDMSIQASTLEFAIAVLNFFVTVLVLIFVILVVITIYTFRRGGIIALWKLSKRVRVEYLFSSYTTYVFSRYLDILMSNGFAIKESLMILTKFSTNELLQYVSKKLRVNFESGLSFDKGIKIDILDKYFCLLCQLGYQSGNIKKALEEYSVVLELRLRKIFKKLSTSIQLVSYGLVALIVIMVYQVMLLPLSILEQI